MLTEPSIVPPQVTRLFAFTIITCAAINSPAYLVVLIIITDN
nr:MAG TPA: hypothetical protein [Caudoviricetes sp.]